MKRKLLNVEIHTEISKKIPSKAKLTNTLMEILCIEKEAVYRRLRGDVPFSFAEVALIAEHLGISLDELTGIQSERYCPFRLQLTDFEKPSDEDLLLWSNYSQIIEIFKENPPFIISETWSTLPITLCFKYPLLARFCIFKWTYQTNKNFPYKHFEEIESDRPENIMGIATFNTLLEATETSYILADTLFLNFLKSLHFFCNIHLITEENKKLILEELNALLDYLEEISIKGEYPETGKKVDIYISELEIDTNYNLYEARGNYICMLRTLVMNAAVTTDEKTYHYMKNWFTAQKRLSTLISVSGEKERIRFFSKQREILGFV